MKSIITIEQHILDRERNSPAASGTLTSILYDIALASKIISREVNKAGLVDILGKTGDTNVQGEEVQKLDMYANDVMVNSLSGPGRVSVIGSEELVDPIIVGNENGKGGYVINMDPLDGSSNIDVNVSIGTIFSVLKTVPGEGNPTRQCTQPGTEQVAAGYVIYGSSTMFVYTTRGGKVNGFTLDPSVGEYFRSHSDIRIPEHGKLYSANEGNYLKWPEGIKKYLKFVQQIDSDSSRPYKSRYIGSLVADFHRNLLKGGVFLYPSDHAHPSGKLRLLYEANPMAMIVENAGGAASTGFGRIMEVDPVEMHQRTPLYIGSKKNVKDIEEFMKESKRNRED